MAAAEHEPEQRFYETRAGRVLGPPATETGSEENRTKSEDPDYRPCRLGPLEAFSNEVPPDGYAAWLQPDYTPETGIDSTTVKTVFASRCCGYQAPPTSKELYKAMRREDFTERDRTVLAAWLTEASEREWFLAWAEQAYSWRMLARAMLRANWCRWDQIRRFNKLAEKPELIKDDAFPADR